MDTSLVYTQTQNFRGHLGSAQLISFHAPWRVGNLALGEERMSLKPALLPSGDLPSRDRLAPFRSNLVGVTRSLVGQAMFSRADEYLQLSYVPLSSRLASQYVTLASFSTFLSSSIKCGE